MNYFFIDLDMLVLRALQDSLLYHIYKTDLIKILWPNFENFKKGIMKKNLSGGNQKGGKIFKNKGIAQLFKMTVGIEKNKNENF